jgi:glycosyltransferase involved in cell wall biosynthesis
MLHSDFPRVGYVVKRYPRYSETFIVNEILAHEEAGWEIDVFALHPPNDTHFQDSVSRVRAPVHYLLSSGVKIADFWATIAGASRDLPRIWSDLRYACEEAAVDVYQAVLLAQAVRNRGITHLHAHFGSSSTTVARLAAKIAGVPYTFTAHAKDIFHNTVCAEDLRRKIHDAASVVTVSDFNAAYLQEHFGAGAGRVVRLYNGLSLDRFPYQAPLGRKKRIISVGRLVPKKGLIDLIEACALMMARGVPFDCQIIGTGPLESELRERIQVLGLENKVRLLGPRPQREVIELMQDAAAFAAPCVVGEDGDRDGLPTVLIEAMALGTPCVSTDVTGIPELIRDRETGVLVPQHDPPALAAAIETVLKCPRYRLNLAEKARKLIEESFDVRRNASEQRSLFMNSERPEHPKAVGCEVCA